VRAANLAAVVALLARDAGAPAIALQVLVYPVTDIGAETRSYRDFADGYLLTRESMRWFTNHYVKSPSEAQDWRVSPLRAASLAGLPPALVITAGSIPCATRVRPTRRGSWTPAGGWTTSATAG